LLEITGELLLRQFLVLFIPVGNRNSHFTKANGAFHFAKVLKVDAANDLALLNAEGRFAG